MEILTSRETYDPHPDDAWKRLKMRLRKPVELAVVQAVAAWREREARDRNVPRGRVLKDDAIYEVAQQQPRDATALARLRTVPKGWERSSTATALLEVVNAALAMPKESMPKLPRLHAGPGRHQRCRRIVESAAAPGRRTERRRGEGSRLGRRHRPHRRRRRSRRRSGHAWLAARGFRRHGGANWCAARSRSNSTASKIALFECSVSISSDLNCSRRRAGQRPPPSVLPGISPTWAYALR